MAAPAHVPGSVLEAFDLAQDRLAIAQQTDRNVLVLAGPGAGKTHLLAARAAYLAELDLGRVVLLTFTNKAAQEMKARVARAGLAPAAARLVVPRTLHAYALELLRTHGHRVRLPAEITPLEARDIEEIGKEVASSLGMVLPERFPSALERYQRLSGDASREPPGLVGQLLRGVDQRMRTQGTLTWEACIGLATELLRTQPDVRRSVRHHDRFILVDEAQDCDSGQLALLSQIVGEQPGTLFMVMDPDQSLYAFRDADPERVLRWGQGYRPVTYELTENRRCAPRIQALAGRVLGRVPSTELRVGGLVGLYGARSRGDEARYVHTQIQERLQAGIPPQRIAVLARAAYCLEEVRSQLDDQGIVHRGDTRPEWSAAEQKVIVALAFAKDWQEHAPISRLGLRFLREVVGLADADVDGLVLDLETSGDHPGDVVHDARWTTLRELMEGERSPAGQLVEEAALRIGVELDQQDALLGIAQQARSLGEVLRTVKQGPPPGRPGADASGGVLVTTYHGAKGLEFDTVFVVACEDGKVPDWRAKDDPALLQERRSLYVAITRAAKEVLVSWAMEERGRSRAPSRFLPEARDRIWHVKA